MRLRNIKDAPNLIKASPYVIEDPKDYKSKWSEVFNNDHPIHIEIGMGKGNFIKQMALLNPDINFIGIEKYASVLVRALEKLDEIPNLRILLIDAKELDSVFDEEVSMIYLNHSDPWPKVRHEKRRLTSKTFLPIYEAITKDLIHIVMKTDNQGLYKYSLDSFLENNYRLIKKSNDYDDPNNILTEYETKFRNLGQVIYYLEILKVK